ncbi:MAG TPA: lysylphosphatidylglycerol synthase transmembrane domain-containing protein [Bacteroidales bacterium]|nr:lysylphosphatidylglycerol synthase transmembrane domain-containing protein [Bacteroidales bacterium]HOK73618.1 lysylphosphatidylglycerol synthase transmembrane domain-containing protein [Bacteroidales bacterium]HOM40587.1 lysylphosphatidylglycerol synthase transmembrane domain-containing protein [Bacteroidales bacterium]HOU29989.1 lysylphosphatidylglycerol synthase transmembrane domain-containing protein [Bacteroidales bacterium]HPP92134.1 lysylphosphatidylglycerol synthase transmembrane dom
MSLKKSIIQLIKFFAFLIAGISLLWLAFRNINFSGLGQKIIHADYKWLVLSIIFATLAYISRARRWVLLIRPLGYNPSFKNTFNAMMTGYLANMALPRIGEITRCIALGKKEKIPTGQLFGTVIIERTVDMLSLLIITFIMLLIKGHLLGSFLVKNALEPFTGKIKAASGSALILWIIILASILLISYLIFVYRKNLRKIRFFAKMFDISKGVVTGLKTITSLREKGEFLFHTGFIWLNYALMSWIVVFTLESTSHLTFSDGFLLLVIGSLAMSAPVQSGLGAFHFIISRGLNGLYGVSLEDGLAYALISHESQLIYGAILGFIAFYLLVKKDRIKLTINGQNQNSVDLP